MHMHTFVLNTSRHTLRSDHPPRCYESTHITHCVVLREHLHMCKTVQSHLKGGIDAAACICNHVDALAHIAKTILQGAARARPAPTAWCCKSTCTCTRQCKHVQGGETWSTPSSVVACYLLCPTHHMSSALKYGSQDTSARCPMRGRREACRAFALSTR